MGGPGSSFLAIERAFRRRPARSKFLDGRRCLLHLLCPLQQSTTQKLTAEKVEMIGT